MTKGGGNEARKRQRLAADGAVERDDGIDRGDGRTKFGTFPEGTSGNLNGRPKGSRNASTILREVLAQTVTISGKDGPNKISKLEAAIAQLVSCGLVDKNIRALERIIALAFSIEDKEGNKQPDVSLGAADRAILESFAARVRNGKRNDP